MISFISKNNKSEKELIIVTGTHNYYEIVYRKGNSPDKVYYGKWQKNYENNMVILTVEGVDYEIRQEEFNALKHSFKTKHCHGETIKERAY